MKVYWNQHSCVFFISQGLDWNKISQSRTQAVIIGFLESKFMLYYKYFNALQIQSCGVIEMESTCCMTRSVTMITLQGEHLICAALSIVTKNVGQRAHYVFMHYKKITSESVSLKILGSHTVLQNTYMYQAFVSMS